jgi:hypothetical protein
MLLKKCGSTWGNHPRQFQVIDWRVSKVNMNMDSTRSKEDFDVLAKWIINHSSHLSEILSTLKSGTTKEETPQLELRSCPDVLDVKTPVVEIPEVLTQLKLQAVSGFTIVPDQLKLFINRLYK